MKPYKCKGCRKVIAHTNGVHFEVGGILLRRSFTMECQACGRVQFWKPHAIDLTEPLAKPEKKAYNSATPA
jgi:hypothetical protein